MSNRVVYGVFIQNRYARVTVERNAFGAFKIKINVIYICVFYGNEYCIVILRIEYKSISLFKYNHLL